MKLKDLNLDLIPFKPLVPVWTGHSQTVLGHIISSPPFSFEYQNEVLTLPDDDQVFLEFAFAKNSIKQNKTLSIYHGLGGNGHSDYVRRSANLAYSLGWNVVMVHHRAASPNATSKKSYHSGRGEDAEAIVEWSRARFQGTVQVALGFSMSGSILLNLLTRRYGEKQPDVAIVVNGPLDLRKSAELLTKGFSKIYDIRFYWMLKRLIQSKHPMNLPFWGRTMDIDDSYTSIQNGFKDRNDYYHQCSTYTYLDRITTPTFILTAKDDPFVFFGDYENTLWPDCVHRTFLKAGGHMGYIQRTDIGHFGKRWLDYYLFNVFQKISEFY